MEKWMHCRIPKSKLFESKTRVLLKKRNGDATRMRRHQFPLQSGGEENTSAYKFDFQNGLTRLTMFSFWLKKAWLTRTSWDSFSAFSNPYSLDLTLTVRLGLKGPSATFSVISKSTPVETQSSAVAEDGRWRQCMLNLQTHRDRNRRRRQIKSKSEYIQLLAMAQQTCEACRGVPSKELSHRDSTLYFETQARHARCDNEGSRLPCDHGILRQSRSSRRHWCSRWCPRQAKRLEPEFLKVKRLAFALVFTILFGFYLLECSCPCPRTWLSCTGQSAWRPGGRSRRSAARHFWCRGRSFEVAAGNPDISPRSSQAAHKSSSAIRRPECGQWWGRTPQAWSLPRFETRSILLTFTFFFFWSSWSLKFKFEYWIRFFPIFCWLIYGK